VFRDLWERGYIVTFGSKFGADFLIYKGFIVQWKVCGADAVDIL
jgi:tRNA splicing endonuclease